MFVYLTQPVSEGYRQGYKKYFLFLQDKGVTIAPGLRPSYRMESYSDTYYIQRIQAGDVESFAPLLDRYGQRIHTLIARIVGNRQDTEELVQDTFMKVFRHLSSFKEESTFSTWIYRIAYNTAISYTRKRKQEFLVIEETALTNVSEEEVTEALGHTDSSEQIYRLEAALALLPPDERALILLFYMKEKTVNDLVQITGLTASNIKTKLHRIRKKLFVFIKDMEEK